MPENIDIYNANLEPIGQMERRQAHREAHWHRTFHCWVVTALPQPAVLFQMRAPRMKNFPNLLDVSAAGHITAGESVEDGVREVREELGLPTEIDNLHFLGERVEVADQDNGQKNREYQSVYLWQVDVPLTSYKPDAHEVYGLFWLPINAGCDLFDGSLESLEIEGIEYAEAEGRFNASTRTVAASDFLPRIQRYYLAALINAERLLDGRNPLAIS